MKKTVFGLYFFIAFFIIVFVLSVNNSNALNSKAVPIYIKSDKVVYNKKNHTYTFTGNVIITRKKFILKAEKVVYYFKTGYAVAVGRVVVNSKGTVTKANKLKVYLKSRIGTIYNTHIHYIDKNIYVYGKKIYHKGKGFYQVEDGYLTSCKMHPPSWKLYSSFSDIYEGSYAYSYNSIFYIHN